MKKTIGIILAIVMMFCGMTSAYAALGDVEAYTTYTDICTYINHFIIESYNIDGYTVVVAEDLVDYGFNVNWDGENRTLYITRNYEKNEIYLDWSKLTYETAPNMIGKQALPVLSTDIKTYVNGIEAKSYNIGGMTVVDFEALSKFGSVQWNPDVRALKLWVEDGLEMLSYPQKPRSLPKTTLYSADGRTISVYEYEVEDYLNVGWYEDKDEANEIGMAQKNKASLSKFRVGQNVMKNIIFQVKYGVVRSIDYNSGKIKVFWNKVTDSYGNDSNTSTANMFFGLYGETWEDAAYLTPMN